MLGRRIEDPGEYLDYDGAVAEGLIERIGAEINQRVDARLGVISRGSDSSATVSRAGTHQAMWTGAAVGAGMTGIVVLIVNAGEPNGEPT